jgi:hypothetical protein
MSMSNLSGFINKLLLLDKCLKTSLFFESYNHLFNFFVETGLYSTCHSKLPSLFITLFEFTPPFFFTQ